MAKKNLFTKILALSLAAMFILGAGHFAGLCGIKLPSLSANAAEEADFTYSVDGNEITITGHSNPIGNLVIPAEINGMPVTKIADSAFNGSLNITSVRIPATVAHIERIAFSNCTSLMIVTFEKRDETQTLSTGSYVFSGCSALSSINLEDANITKMGGGFFFRCSSLEKMAIPETVTEIEGAVFHGCTSLKEVTLNKNITSLDNFGGGVSEGFFQDCTSLKEIVIPANITTIGAKTFLGSGLEKITFENGTGLTTIGEQAFGDSDLRSIVIPATVTSIGKMAFSGCTNLETVTFEKREENQYLSTESDVFADCTALSSINLEDSKVISMGARCFLNCPSLKKIIMPDTLVTVGGGFFNKCTSLSKVTLSKNMTSLSSVYGDYFFGNCKALKEIEIPASITIIGERAFYGSGIEKITFEEGSTLVTIGENAFWYTSLQNITIPESVKVIAEQAFDGAPLKYVVFEGTGSLEIQQAAFIRNYNLTDVYYAGTEEEWNELVTWWPKNECLLNARMHFNSDGPKDNTPEVPDTPDTPDTPDVPALPTVSIRNNTGSKTIAYGETLRLTAIAQNMPADAKIVWYVDGKPMGEGTTFEFTSEGGTAEISVKIVDSNGNNYADSDTQKVTVNAGFFQKIISFFKNLFGFSRIVTQAFRFN